MDVVFIVFHKTNPVQTDIHYRRDMLKVSGVVIPPAVQSAWDLSDAVSSDRRQTLVEAFVQVMMWRRRSSLIKESCTKAELIKRMCAPVNDYALFPCNYVF